MVVVGQQDSKAIIIHIKNCRGHCSDTLSCSLPLSPQPSNHKLHTKTKFNYNQKVTQQEISQTRAIATLNQKKKNNNKLHKCLQRAINNIIPSSISFLVLVQVQIFGDYKLNVVRDLRSQHCLCNRGIKLIRISTNILNRLVVTWVIKDT